MPQPATNRYPWESNYSNFQPQHLANLLLQPASQLFTNCPSLSNTGAWLASTQAAAQVSQQPTVSHNAVAYSSQQDDQLSKASGFVSHQEHRLILHIQSRPNFIPPSLPPVQHAYEIV